MSLSRFDTFARSVVGPSAAGAVVYLCLQPSITTSIPPSPLATIYSDPLGANPIPGNVMVCDGFGHASCYVASGTFTEVVVYGGQLVQVYPDQFIASTIAVQVNGLEVNGNPVTGPNFNSTVPATPVGSTTVIWQFDGLGNVTGSIPTSIFAPIASPAFTGTPTAPTPASSDDSNTIATTAYVQSVLVGSGLVVSVFGRTGAVEAASGDYTVAQITGAAPLASPALTGTPTAPTPATADSSTLLATTAFVKEQGYGVGSVTTFSAANIGGIATASVTNPTNTPALTFTLEAQAANTVWAGPTSGSAATPTFRPLVPADLPVIVITSVPQNAQTGTTYVFAQGDVGYRVTFNNTSAVAVTLPQAGSSGNFISGWYVYAENLGTGLVTITPTTSTINLWPQIVLGQNQVALIFSDGTNYQAWFTKIASTDAASALSSYLTNDAGTGASQNQIVMQDLSVSGVSTKRKALNIYLETAAQTGSNCDGLQVNVGATITSNTSASTQHVDAAEFLVAASGSAVTLPQINAVKVRTLVEASTTVTNVVGVLAYLPEILGTVTNYHVIEFDAPSGGGTVTNYVGINSVLNTAGITVTNAFGGSFGGGTPASGSSAALILDDTNVSSGALAWGQMPTIHCAIYSGTGSPNGVVTANVGSLFLRQDGGSSTTLYVKESGTATNTGWVGK